MPAPWLAAALKAIPWSTLLSQAPSIIETSRKLFSRVPPAAPPERHQVDLNELRTRLEALEANERSQAELLRQVADQMQRLTLGLEVIAARARLGLALGIIALVGMLGFWGWMLLR